MLWNNEIKVEILPYSQYHIDAIVWILWRLVAIDYCVWGGTNEREV
jgi:hypothetical protein